MLEGSSAQAIVFTAPAGYGKTTLAVEWLHGRNRVAWYRATAASADVAAFSAGVSDSVSQITPVGGRLKQRLGVGAVPERAVRSLAELLAEDLARWPSDAWLVIDDYHLVAKSGPVEDFLDWLLTLAPIRIVVTTRRRPAWMSARRLLYGEVLEITQSHLAMTSAEAAKALARHSNSAIRDLLEAAHGWPALIGLAALSESSEIPADSMSDALFRYFAEEVLRQQPKDVQRFMLAASVPTHLDPTVVATVLRFNEGDKFLSRLTDEGLLRTSAKGLVLHPLLRDFLRHRVRELDPDAMDELYARAIAFARSAQQWDDAFELSLEAQRVDMAATIIGEAGPSLLASGRLETITEWFEAVGPAILEYPDAVLAQAETLIRHGRFVEAEALIERVVALLSCENALASRAWCLLGQARHLTSDYASALECHSKAKAHARTADEEARAAWGAFIAAAELEPADLCDYLDEFERLAGDDADGRLRVASGRQLQAEHGGTFAGTWDALRCALTLVPFASDPMAVSNALANASCLNVARADYVLARDLAVDALSFCSSLRLDFAIGYCLVCRGTAEVGLRDFRSARATLQRLDALLSRAEDPHLLLENHILALRLGLATDRERVDVSRTEHRIEGFLPRVPCASRGKYLALQAVAYATGGATSLSRRKADEAVEATVGPEARCLAAFANVIAAAVAEGQPENMRDLASAAFEQAKRLESLDSVVVAYRSYPGLLESLVRDQQIRPTLEQLLHRSNDSALAGQVGIAVESARPNGAHVLTDRQKEVMELLEIGLSTEDIANRLFISRNTAKVHIHNILRKLGASSRLEAVLKWRNLGASS
jgi:LuxR family maltose regulon positive regulatory protein